MNSALLAALCFASFAVLDANNVSTDPLSLQTLVAMVERSDVFEILKDKIIYDVTMAFDGVESELRAEGEQGKKREKTEKERLRQQLQLFLDDMPKRLAGDPQSSIAEKRTFWEKALAEEIRRKTPRVEVREERKPKKHLFDFSRESFLRTPTYIFLGATVAYNVIAVAIVVILCLKCKRSKNERAALRFDVDEDLEVTAVSSDDEEELKPAKKSIKSKKSHKSTKGSKKNRRKEDSEEDLEKTAISDEEEEELEKKSHKKKKSDRSKKHQRSAKSGKSKKSSKSGKKKKSQKKH